MSNEEFNEDVLEDVAEAESLDVSPKNVLRITQTEGLMMLRNKKTTPIAKEELALLKLLSSTALGQLRISTDDENSIEDRAVALEIAKTMGTCRNNPFINLTPNLPARELPVLDAPLVDDLLLSEENMSREYGSPDLIELMEQEDD